MILHHRRRSEIHCSILLWIRHMKALSRISRMCYVGVIHFESRIPWWLSLFYIYTILTCRQYVESCPEYELGYCGPTCITCRNDGGGCIGGHHWPLSCHMPPPENCRWMVHLHQIKYTTYNKQNTPDHTILTVVALHIPCEQEDLHDMLPSGMGAGVPAECIHVYN